VCATACDEIANYAHPFWNPPAGLSLSGFVCAIMA
jgi:hypothetical protein